MFTPINQAHAIAEAIVFFEFAPDLTAVLPTLLGLKETLKQDFPRQEVTQEYKLDVGPGGGALKQLPSGLQLSRFRANGAPEWMINIAPQAISFHCLDYSRWDPVWKEMKTYIRAVFHEMGAAHVSIGAVGLKYVDRFIWKGDVNGYDARQLFKTETPLLHKRAFESGPRWHCHTGWFHFGHSSGEILNQLNVDSGFVMLEGIQAVLVSIDHNQVLRSGAQGSLDQYGNVRKDSVALDDLMKYLHDKNKITLDELLTEEVAKSIKLQASK